MIIHIDTSVLVAAIVSSEEHHEACDALLDRPEVTAYTHALGETFNVLTGGRKVFRLSPGEAVELIEKDYLPGLNMVLLTSREYLGALRACEARGVRGGAIFDYLHLVAARKAKARRLYTLNVSNFRAFHRSDDPEIVHP